ncbi:PREDICTED: uncharacterized protein LOC105144424 [Acromyrmex echinatior]|uniref:uncharacterized protein LOC105144424 n=1 Tax=Acromyrmex echinatior TaxID=103372 RepID=UPI000580EF13|nr:PREDICTED: uncharacterized protein LOC105144424 [Acromyrmex echinatior]
MEGITLWCVAHPVRRNQSSGGTDHLRHHRLFSKQFGKKYVQNILNHHPLQSPYSRNCCSTHLKVTEKYKVMQFLHCIYFLSYKTHPVLHFTKDSSSYIENTTDTSAAAVATSSTLFDSTYENK